MPTYCNQHHGFTIDLPEGWSPTLLTRLVKRNPTVRGPHGELLNFHIGPLDIERISEALARYHKTSSWSALQSDFAKFGITPPEGPEKKPEDPLLEFNYLQFKEYARLCRYEIVQWDDVTVHETKHTTVTYLMPSRVVCTKYMIVLARTEYAVTGRLGLDGDPALWERKGTYDGIVSTFRLVR